MRKLRKLMILIHNFPRLLHAHDFAKKSKPMVESAHLPGKSRSGLIQNSSLFVRHLNSALFLSPEGGR